MEDELTKDDAEAVTASPDLVSSLLTVSRALIALSAQSLVDVEDTLTLSEFRALVVLRTQGSVRPLGLSQRLGFTPETTARIATRMADLGFVTDGGSDGGLELSEAGVEVVDKVTSRRRTLLTDVVARMSEDDQRVLVDALLAFAAAAGEPISAQDDPEP